MSYTHFSFTAAESTATSPASVAQNLIAFPRLLENLAAIVVQETVGVLSVFWSLSEGRRGLALA